MLHLVCISVGVVVLGMIRTMISAAIGFMIDTTPTLLQAALSTGLSIGLNAVMSTVLCSGPNSVGVVVRHGSSEQRALSV